MDENATYHYNLLKYPAVADKKMRNIHMEQFSFHGKVRFSTHHSSLSRFTSPVIASQVAVVVAVLLLSLRLLLLLQA